MLFLTSIFTRKHRPVQFTRISRAHRYRRLYRRKYPDADIIILDRTENDDYFKVVINKGN